MAAPSKRATAYFDPILHKALKLKYIETSRSVSDLVHKTVKAALAEDAEDLAALIDGRRISGAASRFPLPQHPVYGSHHRRVSYL